MKSKFVRPSVCAIDYLCSYCMDFFQILIVASPGPYTQKKLNYEYFSFSFTWDENFKTLLLLQIAAESFQTNAQLMLMLVFKLTLPNAPHKTTFGIFEILEIEILTNFIRFR